MKEILGWHRKHQGKLDVCEGIIGGIILVSIFVKIIFGHWPDMGPVLVFFAFAIGLFLSCVIPLRKSKEV